MKNSLLRQVMLCLAPVIALAILGGSLFSGQPSGPQAAAYTMCFLLALSGMFLVLQRVVSAPLTQLGKGLAHLRAASGPLPKDLPIQRTDELGNIAREAALIAGERNVSEIRRLESEIKIAALTDAIADSILRLDQDGHILGHQAPKHEPSLLIDEPALGKKLADLLPGGVADKSVAALARVFTEKKPQHFDFVIEARGESRSYQARFALSGDNEVLAIVRDTTQQKATHSSKARLDTILDATFDPVVTITTRREIRYLNPAANALLGITEPSPRGLNLDEFLPDWARKQIEDITIPTSIEEGVWQGDSALTCDGEEEVPISLTAVPHRSDKGTVDLISLIARDQRERKRFDDHLLFLADHDPLTSLYTRRRFVEELGRELARAQRSGSGGAVLLLDLDDLKYVNDSLGHSTGDKLLAELSQLLRKHVRANDMLARLDGDEFAVLITETRPSRVEFVAERLLKAIRNHSVDAGEQPVGVTGSAGIAFYPEQGASAEELLSRADQALARAKQRGRDQFVVFKPDEKWQAQVDSRLSGEKLIREALARGRFILHAQPILDLKTDEIVQFEILLRMLGPNNELMPPASFLATAERFGLIRSIDRWVVRQSIKLMGRQQKIGNSIRLSVNLSGKSLGDFELTTLIEKELEENEVDPKRLTFEITETTAISDTERAKIFAIALKQIGCRLALDDFGVGFSSFHKLKTLPVDYLKIDGSFIRDLPKNKVDQHLVRAMVEVARALRKRTVAEFVGSEETLELVKQAGVDFGQGFHIGKPDAVETFLPQMPAAETKSN
jgi:diguanylate cyclase (GGDEF)-like protein/PAS domain S-box-containing protein